MRSFSLYPVSVLFILLSTSVLATKNDSTLLTLHGTEVIKSDFFRERYLHNSMTHYLENYDDYVTYESETTGDFNLPDLTIFSISGNSYKWNKYYLDGFRIDNRIFPGSNFFNPDLSNHSLKIDYYNSMVGFSTDAHTPNSISFGYNVGSIGGISPSTQSLINLFHNTASQRLYKPIDYRRNMKGAGTLNFNYSLPIAGKNYTQQVYVDFGTRMLVDFDYEKISEYYPENFFKVQLSGQLPFTLGTLFDNTNYLAGFSQRDNLFSELYFGKSETAKNKAFNFSFYGNKKFGDYSYTSGLTLATNHIQHNEPNFSRNIVDQDGEAFEPWYPSANTIELSHFLNFSKDLTPNVKLVFEGYNSVLNFNPTQQFSRNSQYIQNVDSTYQALYVTEWESNPFTSGLLENTLRLQTARKLSRSIDLSANIDGTLDGMLLSSKSLIRVNWQGQIGLNFHPASWFTMELNVARKRVSFNFDHIRYFSNDYMNGNMYYWNDLNNDKTYQENEKSDFFTSTGGKYHKAVDNLKQQAYYVIDVPFYFHFGRHEISLLNTFKKYTNNWTTKFDKDAADYGYYKMVDGQQIFFFNAGVVNYLVDTYSNDIMKSQEGANLLTNSPYYFSSVVKYQYTTKKFLFSMAWTSYIMTGISTLGNGPLHNNLDVFSETSANPNINYKLIGRLNQERAFLARMFLSYKVCKNFSFAVTAKFKDGQPFTNFNTSLAADPSGNTQVAVWSNRTKGINPFNNDFGSREDAFFNIDLSTVYTGKIARYNYEIKLMMYNLYDFGTELGEYTFQAGTMGGRDALELNIPRGLMISTKLNF